ncbi:hypothetical protein ANO11243_051540 [Dothideomycetidae sp. 11243]|nr:hypothetical protein ANO11243_051540 [fungal sp. No.11243]
MPPQQPSFQPTSLDFINRPNPVEPSNINHSHDSSSSRHLESRTNSDFLRALQHSRNVTSVKAARSSGESMPAATPHSGTIPTGSINPVATLLNQEFDSSSGETSAASRSREADQTHLTLPLPSKQGTQRQQTQVPPVLQGLHHPPPNAGLLPSMYAEKAQSPQDSRPTQEQRSAEQAQTTNPTHSLPRKIIIKVPAKALLPRPTRRNKWTDEETHTLLQGTRRFGVGNWKKILTCPDYSFNHRTATDLKDRFRVVSSNKEMLLHFKIYAAYKNDLPDLSGEGHLASASTTPNPEPAIPGESSSTHTLEIELDLPRAKRRQRTKWSEEEDEALLRGFGRYGPSWTSIQLDPVLKKRTPTDIRDRIRTRFSEEYTKAGLTPKPSKPRTQMRSQPKQPLGERSSSTRDGEDGYFVPCCHIDPRTGIANGPPGEMGKGKQCAPPPAPMVEQQQQLPSLPSLFAQIPGANAGDDGDAGGAGP